MGWKSSLAIHLGFWLYLVGGGIIYYFIENPGYHLPPVEKPMTINSSFCQDLLSSIEHYASIGDAGEVNLEHNNSFEIWFEAINESCNNLTLNLNKTDGSGDLVWEFSSALFLCMTILTTIAYSSESLSGNTSRHSIKHSYGDFSPKSDWGKIFCIFYGFTGIPICGVLLASTSDYFSNMFLYLYEQRRKKEQQDQRRSIFIAAVIFLIPGLAVFFFFPSAIFAYIENWSYLDATYFSFLTLTTIGFGDIIAAQQPNFPLLWLYRVSWIIWVLLGIAYWAIIINFITKALKVTQSKKLRQQWAKTSQMLSVQAQEMRRVVKRQLSGLDNGSNGSVFLALKTKSAFDFALQFTGSMGKSMTKSMNEPMARRRSLTDILKVFESSVPGYGFNTQQQLSITDQCLLDFPGDEVNYDPSSPQTDSSPRMSLSTEQNGSTIDLDFDDNASLKTSATSNGTPFTANPSTETPPLRDLLIEAIMILNEAEANGTDLNQ
uniref:Potassium channel domain-containing protein n=1 Tax=Daphnia galeata TaxID=27404 RepID=A0A8J2RSS7_9CRUS|nr:unnamed protein product [Daphnia galeata]